MEKKEDLFNYYKNSLTNGLCQDYVGRWRSCGDNKDALVKLVMAQQSLPHFIYYCNNGIGLSKEYIIDNFYDYINGRKIIDDADGVHGYTYSIYVGFKGVFSACSDVVAMLWTTNALCTINETKSPVLYIGCKSKVHISLDGYNCPRIYLFDESEITIDVADEDSKIVIYKYSSDAKVMMDKYCLADVKIFNKELKL